MPRAYGEGRVYLRADGRYQVVVSVDGRPIYRYTSTEAEAEKVRRELVRRKRAGKLRPDAPRTERLDDLLDRWLDMRDGPGLNARSLRQYRRRLDLHVRPHLGRVRVGDLKPRDVDACLREMVKAGLSTTTIAIVRETLAEALEWAVDLEDIARNPAKRVKAPKGKPPVVRTPPEHEHAIAFLDAAAGHPRAPFWHLAAYLGLRRGEILGLTWPAIDLDRAVVRVDAQLKREGGAWAMDGTKTASGVRTLPLCGDLPDMLRARRERQRGERGNAPVPIDRDLVFGEIHTGLIHRWTVALTRQAGLPEDSIGLHRFRHGVATALLEMDAPARMTQAILGHARKTTTDRYQAVSVEAMRPWCERLAGRFERLHGVASNHDLSGQ